MSDWVSKPRLHPDGRSGVEVGTAQGTGVWKSVCGHGGPCERGGGRELAGELRGLYWKVAFGINDWARRRCMLPTSMSCARSALSIRGDTGHAFSLCNVDTWSINILFLCSWNLEAFLSLYSPTARKIHA